MVKKVNNNNRQSAAKYLKSKDNGKGSTTSRNDVGLFVNNLLTTYRNGGNSLRQSFVYLSYY